MSLTTAPLYVDIANPDKNGIVQDVDSQAKGSSGVSVRGDITSIPFYPVSTNPGDVSFSYWISRFSDFDPAYLSYGYADADRAPTSGTTALFYDGDGSGMNAISATIIAENLQAAMNANVTVVATGQTVTVEAVNDGAFYVRWSGFGAKELFQGTGEGFAPQSNVAAWFVKEGDGDTKAVQFLAFVVRPYAFIAGGEWTETPDVAAEVTVLAVGSSGPDVKAKFQILITPPPYAGSFTIKDSAPIAFNANEDAALAALGTGWGSVVKTASGLYAIERATAGVYTLVDGDINVTGLSVFRGFTGTLSLNKAALYERFASEDSDTFTTKRQIRYDDGTNIETLLLDDIVLTKDILNSASTGPSDWNNLYWNRAQSDARYLKLSGGTMTGDLDMGGNKIENLAEPSAGSDAATLTTVLTSANPVILPYFTDAAESLHLAISTDGGKFFNFSDSLYAGVNATLRDPSLIYKNGIWYLAYTPNGFSGSDEMYIARSRDLINWSAYATIDLSSIGDSSMRVWSPEFFTDDDGSIHIVVSCNDNYGSEPEDDFKIYLLSAEADDLSAWSEPQLIFDAFPAIDPCLFKENGTYYLWYKNEASGQKVIEVASASSIDGTYTRIKSGDWAGWGNGLEGPTILKRGPGDYLLYVDAYVAGGVKWATSSSLLSGWSGLTTIEMDGVLNTTPNHGSPIVCDSRASNAVLSAVFTRLFVYGLDIALANSGQTLVPIKLRNNGNAVGTGIAIDALLDTSKTALARWQAVRNDFSNGYCEFNFLTWNGSALAGRARISGGAESDGRLDIGRVKLTPKTVTQLLSASTEGNGTMCYVTDATATTPGSTVAGGGSNKVLVISDGTNWVIR